MADVDSVVRSRFYQLRQLRSVRRSVPDDATADLSYEIRGPHHDALACLHWLRVPERIDYKVAVLTYKVLHGSAPRYLGPLVPVADQPGRRTLRSGGTNRLMVVQQSVTGRSRLLDRTPCLEHSAGGDNDVADALYLRSTT